VVAGWSGAGPSERKGRERGHGGVAGPALSAGPGREKRAGKRGKGESRARVGRAGRLGQLGQEQEGRCGLSW
jgi:hypothetical protein